MTKRAYFASCISLAPFFLSACGIAPPQLTEAWEEREIDNDMEYRIKRSIFCEVVSAINKVNYFYESTTGSRDVIPKDYGVQLQTTLTVEENTAINPSISYNKTFPSATESRVNVGQTFNLGFGGTLSATASRIDTAYSYYVVGKIAGEGKQKDYCFNPKEFPIDRHGSSLLLQSDLGIERYLKNAVKASVVIPSSVPSKKKKDVKLDVYSYEVKFVLVTNGSINPTWRLVNVSSGTGSLPLFGAGRTRTHDLLLTFGPNSDTGFAPSLVALEQHVAQTISGTFRGRTLGGLN